MDKPRAHLMALAAIILFFAAFFGPVLVSGKLLIAGDAYYQSYPLRMIAWDAIRRCELPLWTPLVFSGYPLLSMAQVAIGYPLTWTYLLLPGHWAEQLIVFAPFLLAPLFTYAYAREVGRSHLAALLAGLAFTYSGNLSSKLGGLGLMANPEMWLPLFLLAIERARTRSFASSLLGATGAYAMSVLAGQAQAFLLVGIVALFYALFVSLILPGHNTTAERWSWGRWKPLVVAFASSLLAIGLAAFQILESMRVVRRSVRSSLSFQVFTFGAFTPLEALRSFIAPLYHYIEVSTYVALPVFALALCAVVWARTTDEYRRRVLFWCCTAAAAWLLMLGDNTPLYRLLYYVPVVNLFRYPSRHAFEWTFALSMLAAYGFDGLNSAFARRQRPLFPLNRGRLVTSVLLLIAAAVLAVLWQHDATARPRASNFGLDSGLIPALPEYRYVMWKAGFTAIVLVSAWCAFSLTPTRSEPPGGQPAGGGGLRALLLGGALALALYVEPQILLAHVWFPYSRPVEAFTATPEVERWLQQQPEQHRIYTRVNLFVRGYWTPPPLDLPNMTAVRGFENVAGYEQLILSRYSRALGDVGPDAVNRYGTMGAPDETLFAQRSHVLSLLNTRFVVSFPHLSTMPEDRLEKDGLRFATSELAHNLLPGEAITLAGEAAAGDTLALVTSLSASVPLEQGSTVARVRIVTTTGETLEREIQAGRDTAEWAHERADVRPAIKHQLAAIFDTKAGDAANSFPAHRYLARIALGERRRVALLEVINVAKQAQLALWKATVYDSEQKQSATLASLPTEIDVDRWQPVLNQNGIVVWQNLDVLPRAWLVADAEAVDGEEALRRIRGEGSNQFDPRRVALLEVLPNEIIPLPGGNLAPESTTRVVGYSPNRLTIETSAPTATVLIVSEIFYPGWEAWVDGQRTKILAADYLLRAVSLTAGQHTVEMRYAAPAVKAGAVISAFALLLVCGLGVYVLREKKQVSRFTATPR